MARALLVCFVCFFLAKGEKQDLPADAKLRVAVKYRPDGCVQKSKKGDVMSIHYEGRLRKDDSKFDSSYERDSPFVFTLGSGQVIKGWDQGEKRRLTIPSGFGYGESGSPPRIPGRATIVFDVELLAI